MLRTKTCKSSHITNDRLQTVRVGPISQYIANDRLYIYSTWPDTSYSRLKADTYRYTLKYVVVRAPRSTSQNWPPGSLAFQLLAHNWEHTRTCPFHWAIYKGKFVGGKLNGGYSRHPIYPTRKKYAFNKRNLIQCLYCITYINTIITTVLTIYSIRKKSF